MKQNQTIKTVVLLGAILALVIAGVAVAQDAKAQAGPFTVFQGLSGGFSGASCPGNPVDWFATRATLYDKAWNPIPGFFNISCKSDYISGGIHYEGPDAAHSIARYGPACAKDNNGNNSGSVACTGSCVLPFGMGADAVNYGPYGSPLINHEVGYTNTLYPEGNTNTANYAILLDRAGCETCSWQCSGNTPVCRDPWGNTCQTGNACGGATTTSCSGSSVCTTGSACANGACTNQSTCVADTCTAWVNQGCGVSGCPATQMRQTRDCTYNCGQESRCVSSLACEKQPPVANAKASVNTSAGPYLEVVNIKLGDNLYYSSSGSFDPDGGSIVKYEWDFLGDGGVDSIAANPQFTVNISVINAAVLNCGGGFCSVTTRLTVTDDEGQTASDIVTLNVKVSPVAKALVSKNSTGPFGKQVTVALMKNVYFKGDTSYDADGGTLSYLWDLTGDGRIDSNIANPTWRYDLSYFSIICNNILPCSFTAMLIVTDDEGMTASDLVQINFAGPLTASCGGSPNPSPPNQPVLWAAAVNGGAGPYVYAWSGTDGLSGSGQTATKTYATEGAKTANVTVTSDDGQTVQATCQINVEAPPLNVSCTGTPPIAELNQNVLWAANISGGTGVYQYSWSGTDNLSGSGSSVTKSYATAGTKTANLTASSGIQTKSSSCSVEVRAIPIADATVATSATGTYGTSVEIAPGDAAYFSALRDGNGDGQGSYDPDGGALVSYTWDFGDGTSSSSAEPSHIYEGLGEYTVRLTVRDNEGDAGTDTVLVKVSSILSVSCAVNPPNPYIGDIVQWDGIVRGGSGQYIVTWRFDDNNDSKTDKTYFGSQDVYRVYDSAGLKKGTIQVVSGDQVKTAECTVTVQSSSAFLFPRILARLSSLF